MEAISARFAPFPPRRFFISARPSAWKWITENSQNVPCTCKDQDFKLYRFCRINNTLHLHPMVCDPLWPFTPCHLQSRRPTLPWRKQNSNLDHLVNSWTSNAASQDTLTHLPLQVDSEKNSFANSDTQRHESENGWCVDIIWIMLYDGSNDLLEHSGQRCPRLPASFVWYLDLAVA